MTARRGNRTTTLRLEVVNEGGEWLIDEIGFADGETPGSDQPNWGNEPNTVSPRNMP